MWGSLRCSARTGILVLLATGALSTAVRWARAEKPENQIAAFHRAEALTEQRKWPEAAAAWQRVVDVNPTIAIAWHHLGVAHQENKEYRKAIPAFATAGELGAGYPFIEPYRMARCYALLGEKEEALQSLQKALDHGFRSLETIRNEKDFSSLRDDERFRKMAAIVDAGRLSRDEGWRFDLDLLAREIKRTHYAPFRKISREQFDANVRKLREDVPQLTDNQIIVGFKKMLQGVGDGHTNIMVSGRNARNLPPVDFYLFTEGVFITSADARFADLAGAQVLRVGGHPVQDVIRALDDVIPADNSMTVRWHAPAYLRSPKILNGLGLIPDEKSLPLTIRDSSGQEREIVLPADSGEPQHSWASARQHASAPEPLYLKNLRQAYWLEYLPEQRMVYFQYNSVSDAGKETIRQFCERLFRFIDEHDVGKLVIDLRWNGGGNNFLNAPLLHGLIRCDKINQPGKLFAIVGRNTFSAAMCGATQINRETKAIFVGEPTGSSPNFVGESAVIVNLPYSKLRASISDLYWQNSVAMDYRTWIAPEIYTPPSFVLYRANRDPAMEAILTYKGEKETGK